MYKKTFPKLRMVISIQLYAKDDRLIICLRCYIPLYHYMYHYISSENTCRLAHHTKNVRYWNFKKIWVISNLLLWYLTGFTDMDNVNAVGVQFSCKKAVRSPTSALNLFILRHNYISHLTIFEHIENFFVREL